MQGELGHHFYMIDQGCFNVFVEQEGDTPIATYEAGDSFGACRLCPVRLRRLAAAPPSFAYP